MRLVLCFLLLSSFATAQSADALITDAMPHLRKSLEETVHYTYLDTEHDHSFIDNKFNEDRTKVSETIFLEGSPYTRLLSVNGKPLSGKALAREQALYDQAVRERRSVSEVKSEHQKEVHHTVVSELSRVEKDFDHRLVGHEVIDGHPCVIVLAEVKASAAATRKYTFWIDEQSHQVLRYEEYLLVAQDKILPGSTFSHQFKPVDGVLLLSENRMDISWDEPAFHNKRVHLIATHTFTDYRRFRTTVTIGPATLTPPE